MEKKRDSFFLNKKTNKADKKVTPQTQPNKRQEEFDKHRDVKSEKPIIKNENGGSEKKPFDKKTYRLKKYSKKYKLEQWEEQRKKRLMRDYQKEIKNEAVTGTYKPISFDEDAIDGNEVGKYVRHPDIIEKENLAIEAKRNPFQRAKEKYNKIKQEKEQKKQEIERVKAERIQKLDEYKKRKHERYKKLSKKTKKGQPVMTGRLELLLDKIQKNT